MASAGRLRNVFNVVHTLRSTTLILCCVVPRWVADWYTTCLVMLAQPRCTPVSVEVLACESAVFGNLSGCLLTRQKGALRLRKSFTTGSSCSISHSHTLSGRESRLNLVHHRNIVSGV